jgi:hypothetical protein
VTPSADTGLMRRLVLALCALTLLSGCGSGVDKSLIAAAVHKTEGAGGAEIAMQMKMDVPGRDEPMVITGSGVADMTGEHGRMTLTMPYVGEMEAVTDGLTVYVHSDLFARAFGGEEWMKVDAKRTSESLGLDMDSLKQMGGGSSDQLRMLGEVSNDITDEGRDTVVGVETTHYHVTLDLRKYPGQDVDRLIELIGEDEIPMDVWIDDQERVRRMEWEQSFHQAGVDASAELVIEYVRFGVPVDVDIPDEDEVFDMTDLTGQMLERLN